MTEVRNAEELLDALGRKDDEIRILGDYCAEIGGTVKERTGELIYPSPSPAGAGAAAYNEMAVLLIESIVNKVTGVDKDTAKMERKLKLYNCVSFRAEEICLRLRQLDY